LWTSKLVQAQLQMNANKIKQFLQNVLDCVLQHVPCCMPYPVLNIKSQTEENKNVMTRLLLCVNNMRIPKNFRFLLGKKICYF